MLVKIIGGFGRGLLYLFKNAFIVIGTLIATVIVLAVLGGVFNAITDKGLPRQAVLVLDASKGFADSPSASPFGGGGRLDFISTLLALRTAEKDTRVKGLVLLGGGAGLSAAHVEELTAALKAFRAAQEGRFVLAYADSYTGPGLGQYSLAAAAADEIWMQRSGEMSQTGLYSSTLFLRGFFDFVKAKAEFGQRYEFKNAANVYTQTDYTPEHREATLRYMQSVYDTLTALAAPGRKLDAAEYRRRLDGGPYLGAQAMTAGLVDKLGFPDDAVRAAKERAGENADTVSLAEYFVREGSAYTRGYGASIAVVFVDGGIANGKSSSDPYSGRTAGGETISKAIHDAAKDDAIKAIVLRVSSPGGAVIGSDMILDALRKAQGRGKKVFVSMGPVAASGGYWVSMYADRIFASPTTITGSIGVLSGKLVIDESLAMAGLSAKQLTVGSDADIYSAYSVFTPEQRALFEAGLDDIYARFTFGVSEGRKLPLETVQANAKGRVWTGADAMERKLIDAYGGFFDALDAAASAAGIATADVRVRFYPKQTAYEAFWESLEASASIAERLAALGRLLESDELAEVFSAFSAARESTENGAQLRMDPVTVR